MTSYEPELEQQRRTQQQAPQQSPDQDSTQRLASAIGNQAFGALARQGAGILPDGRAHPDVESAIAQTRGDGPEARRRAPATRSAARSATRSTTSASTPIDRGQRSSRARSPPARSRPATTSTSRKDEYKPGSSDGQELLAHELTHVVQQRGASTSGPLTVSQPGDALENEAEAAAGDIVG